MCGDTGKHFNPFNVDKSSSPPNGQGSSDQYEVGDLSGKYGDLAMKTEVAGSFVDPSITLFGRLSIVGRSVVIHKSPGDCFFCRSPQYLMPITSAPSLGVRQH